MNLSTAVSLARSGRLPMLGRVARLSADFTHGAFLSAASRAGLLRLLAPGPQDLPAIARALGVDPATEGEALRGWLDVGVAVGALARRGEGWGLHSRLARGLARPENDDLAAMLEEVGTLHHRLVAGGPDLLRRAGRLTLADQDGAMVARSSRVLEPLVQEALDAVLPRQGALRLLEVGCGSGTHVRHALERNPALQVHALELQPEVARVARDQLQAWGLADRCQVQEGDVRSVTLPPELALGADLLTLHNNIYYFPDAERVALLRHLRGLLRPGGTLLVTTACTGGSASMQVLHLWGLLTAGAGPLPAPEALQAQMAEAGFQEVRAWNLAAPVDSFWGFVGRAPPS